jgi:uncharacterized membrane protein (TIGR02234 family)
VTSRRLAVLLALAGAGLVLLAGTRSWAGVSFRTDLPGLTGLAVPGRKVSPAGIPVALAVAAAAVVLALSGRLVRFLVATGLVVAGVGLLAVAVRALGDPGRLAGLALRDAVGVYGAGGGDALGGGANVSVTAWVGVAAGGAALMLAAGLVTVVRGRSWPGPTRRYERARSSPSPWDALSRGEDPTSTGVDAT